MTTYIALLRKDPVSDVGVDFPDFPGCITAGKTLDTARVAAAEALEFHIKGMLADLEPIPKPSSLDEVMEDPANRDAIAFLVEVSTVAARSIRVNVVLPEDLITAIDRVANNRSRFLVEAARTKLAADYQTAA